MFIFVLFLGIFFSEHFFSSRSALKITVIKKYNGSILQI